MQVMIYRDEVLLTARDNATWRSGLERRFLWRPWSQGWWFNSQPSLVVASLDKMLHVDYLYLVKSGKRQIK